MSRRARPRSPRSHPRRCSVQRGDRDRAPVPEQIRIVFALFHIKPQRDIPACGIIDPVKADGMLLPARFVQLSAVYRDAGQIPAQHFIAAVGQIQRVMAVAVLRHRVERPADAHLIMELLL